MFVEVGRVGSQQCRHVFTCLPHGDDRVTSRERHANECCLLMGQSCRLICEDVTKCPAVIECWWQRADVTKRIAFWDTARVSDSSCEFAPSSWSETKALKFVPRIKKMIVQVPRGPRVGVFRNARNSRRIRCRKGSLMLRRSLMVFSDDGAKEEKWYARDPVAQIRRLEEYT